MLSRIVSAADRAGIKLQSQTVAISLAAIDNKQPCKTLKEGPNYVVQSWGKQLSYYSVYKLSIIVAESSNIVSCDGLFYGTN